MLEIGLDHQNYTPGRLVRAPQSGLPLALHQGAPLLPATSVKRRWALRGKRALDIVGAALGLALFSIPLAILGLIIRLSDGGPAFYSQRRLGRDGKGFVLYKLRTLRHDACDATGVHPVAARDTRVTRLGQKLRDWDIDELPQLFNVLRGDMALIGPRPHVAQMRVAGAPYEKAVPYYASRLAVRPGMTGWAQVNGHRGRVGGPAQARARVDHDVAYIQQFSLGLDLKILAATLRQAIR